MSYKVIIIGNIDEQEKTWDLVHFLCQQHGLTEKEADVFAVAVGEAYGNGLLYSPGHYSELLLDFQMDQISAEITNKGEEIKFHEIDEFSKDQDFQKYKDGSLGIPMIKTLVDEVTYTREKGKNRLILKKFINSDKNAIRRK
ncbi:MAG: ATP-binding protein [Candidatus Marinimicrobia bacterium]|nr:ATP-binding protein [Candidatus Neomarinimicrobiota bacterium]